MLSFLEFVTEGDSHLHQLDPHKVHFTEKGQDHTPYVGDPHRPILAYKTDKGEHHVIDGHHRVLHARKHGTHVNAIVMPHSTYREFQKAGIHQGEMHRAYARKIGDERRKNAAV